MNVSPVPHPEGGGRDPAAQAVQSAVMKTAVGGTLALAAVGRPAGNPGFHLSACAGVKVPPKTVVP